MKGKAIVPLALGLCVGLFGVKFLMDTVKKAQGETSEKALSTMVRAKQDISAFAKIDEDMLELVETSDPSLVPFADRITRLDEVLGRVVGKSIPQSVPLLKSMLAPVGTMPGMVGRIPKGFRAVSVKIDEVTSVAYQLQPDDWVDVIAVMDVDTGSRQRKKQTIAEVILQHVKILAIGRTMGGVTSSANSKAQPAKSATLLVAAEDAPKLRLAATKGRITLSLRGDDVKTTENPLVAGESVFASSSLFGMFAPKLTAPTAAQPKPVPFQLAQVSQRHPFGMTVFYGPTSSKSSFVQRFTFENEESRSIIALQEGPVDHAVKDRGDDTPSAPSVRQEKGNVGAAQSRSR